MATLLSPHRKRGPGELDFSCAGPLLMLDVNAALEGNVEQSFTDYDHDVNLKIFRTLCERYKVKVSEQEAIDIVRHVEGFKPARRETE